MIEKTILDHLNASLAVADPGVIAYMETPKNAPARWIRIEKTGGGSSQHGILRRATLAVQSYAPSLYEAAALNETVKSIMNTAAAIANVSRCALNSDYNYTNEAKKEYRYQAVFDLVYFE